MIPFCSPGWPFVGPQNAVGGAPIHAIPVESPKTPPILTRRCNLGLGERPGLDEAPIINHNCLGNAHDLDVIVEGVKIARRILTSSAMDDYRGVERFGGIDVQSDDQIRDYAPSNVQTIYHPVGTHKMGSDGMAVVGADLRGHGIDGLRIADASIMPTIIIGNNNATSIIIGEKPHI